jgi:rod shape-determining protein MreC
MAQRPNLSRQTWIVLGIVFAALLMSIGVLKPLQKLFIPVIRPIASSAHSIGARIDGFLSERRNITAIRKENTELNKRIVELEQTTTELNQKLSSLKLLREEEDFLKRKKISGKLVYVLGREQTNAQELLIDRGSADGIAVGMPAIDSNGIMVGIVNIVNESTASVRLLTAEGTNVAVRVERSDGPPGVIIGELGTGIRMTLVPQNQVLKNGDTIVTSDLETKIPSGLLIGSITSIDAQPGALFQTASVLPAISYNQLSILTILSAK